MEKAVIELEPWVAGASEEEIKEHVNSLTLSLDNLQYIKDIKMYEHANQRREDVVDYLNAKIKEFEHDL